MKLLIIEDEQALSDSIFTYINSENFVCETAYNNELGNREDANIPVTSCPACAASAVKFIQYNLSRQWV